MSYAYADGVVFLEELAAEDHPMVHDLCAMHASSIRVPRGWELRDDWSAGPQEAGSNQEQVRLDLIGA